MQKVWSSDEDIQNIGPTSKSVTVGWDKIGKAFEALFAAFPDLKATMKPGNQIVAAVAWMTGIDRFRERTKLA